MSKKNDEKQGEDQQQKLALMSIFMKDTSFNAESSIMSFKDKWKPQVSVDLNFKSEPLTQDDLVDITLILGIY